MKIHIHGKRVETIYAFTVEDGEGRQWAGRQIFIKEQDEDEPLPYEDYKTDFDDKKHAKFTNPEALERFDELIFGAIKDYEKDHA